MSKPIIFKDISSPFWNEYPHKFFFEGPGGINFACSSAENAFHLGKYDQCNNLVFLLKLTSCNSQFAWYLGNLETIEAEDFPEQQEEVDTMNAFITEYKEIVTYDKKGWRKKNMGHMRKVLLAKFADEKMKEVLLATGSATLIEESEDDCFWATIRNEDGELKGENMLGKMLMEIRTELQ